MNNCEWIKFTRVGFTDDELKDMKDNPIKSTCGTCKKDVTGMSCNDIECLNDECPCKYSEC